MFTRLFTALACALAITAGAFGAGTLSLLGVGAASSGLPPTSFAYQTANNIVATQATYTFTSQAIGTAAADRTVIVAIGVSGVNGSTLTGVTVGGIACTLLSTGIIADGPEFTEGNTIPGGTQAYPTRRANFAFWSCAVPTGTTANIVGNCSNANCFRVMISVWAAYTLSVGFTDANVYGNNPGTGPIDNLTGGFILGCQLSTGAAVGAQSMAWTNLTERNDVTTSNLVNMSCADASTTGTVTVTVTRTGAGGYNGEYGLSLVAFH
jgi:hypothetical protein